MSGNNFVKKIISGGQTGVDRAALDIAIELKIPHEGWCPYGRKSEDGIIPVKYNLTETCSPTPDESKDPDFIYKKRTELNVKDSTGTLIIVNGTPIGGTLYTIEMAEKHKKPFFIFNFIKKSEVIDIVNWIIKNNIIELNIAGPRASQTSDIYQIAYDILTKVLTHSKLQA